MVKPCWSLTPDPAAPVFCSSPHVLHPRSSQPQAFSYCAFFTSKIWCYSLISCRDAARQRAVVIPAGAMTQWKCPNSKAWQSVHERPSLLWQKYLKCISTVEISLPNCICKLNSYTSVIQNKTLNTATHKEKSCLWRDIIITIHKTLQSTWIS